MIRKSLFIISHLFLLAYGIIHSVYFNLGSTFLDELFALNVDPLLFMVFNLLGMIPLAFFLYFKQNYDLKWFHILILLSGFVLGGFGLGFIIYLMPKTKPLKYSKKPLWAGFIITLVLLFYGLLFGDINAYIEAFNTDTFVHIMTIDLAVLMIFYITLPLLKLSWTMIGFVPIFYLSMLNKDYDETRR
jgi:hypothetical protein